MIAALMDFKAKPIPLWKRGDNIERSVLISRPGAVSDADYPWDIPTALRAKIHTHFIVYLVLGDEVLDVKAAKTELEARWIVNEYVSPSETFLDYISKH